MTESMSASEAKSLQIRLEASGLDAIRATKILESIGIKGASLRDVEDNVLIFTVHNFLSCVAPLTKAFGRARNESNPAWAQKRLVWLVKEHNGVPCLALGDLTRPDAGVELTVNVKTVKTLLQLGWELVGKTRSLKAGEEVYTNKYTHPESPRVLVHVVIFGKSTSNANKTELRYVEVYAL